MRKNKAENDDLVTVTVELEGEIAAAFLASARTSGRSNRKEAKFRIIDHIERYSALNQIGDCVVRKAHH